MDIFRYNELLKNRENLMNKNRFIILCIALSTFIFADLSRNKNMVIDNKTNLIWQDDIASKNHTAKWIDAKKHCKKLKLGGYTKWRLPNIIELLSIVDKHRYNPAMSSTFKNITPLYYWSSSPYKPSSINAWGADFSNGNDGAYNKSHSIYVRCVHSK